MCINGKMNIGTRGYVEDCLALAALGRVPKGGACINKKLQAERIAQVRFMQNTNPLFLPTQIPPSTQWEVATNRITVPGCKPVSGIGYIDVLQYQPGPGDPSTKSVEVWEVKGAWNGGANQSVKNADCQAQQYVESLKKGLGWNGAHLGTSQLAYTDEFTIIKAFKCPNGEIVDLPYSVSVPQAGVIAVRAESPDCSRKPNQSEAEAQAEVEEELALVLDSDGDEDVSEHGGARANVSFEKIIVGVTTVAVVGRVALDVLLRSGSEEICLTMSRVPPFTNSEINEPGKLCFAGQAAMIGALAAGADPKAATDLFKEQLIKAVTEGYLTTDELAAILGVEVSEAAKLVATSRARASGDPHLITLDGLNYDLQSVGEFMLAEIPEAGVRVQARFVETTPDLSSVNSIAFTMGGGRVEMRPDGSVAVEGETVAVDDQEGFSFDDGSFIVRDGSQLLAQWPRRGLSHSVALSWEPRNGIGFVGLSIPDDLRGHVSGLLGNFDGESMNDLRLRDGSQLPADASATVLHDGLADSWRLDNWESLFTYATGQSTSTFTNLAFPRSIVTRGDFSEEQRAAAMVTCQQFGVAAGPSFDDCELDVMATGNWAFAAAAAKVRVRSIVAGDRVVDPAGYVGEDFEGSVPNNFSPVRVGEKSGLTTFAGPFTGQEQYRFYVPQLPGHDRATLSFDLIAFGTWSAADAVTLRVDDAIVGFPIDWSLATSGTGSDGLSYSKLRVQVPVDHHISQVAATFSATGLTSIGNRGFAIDDIAVGLHLVPAQVFDAHLARGVPQALGDISVADGSGKLETRGSVDRYSLTIPGGGPVYLDWDGAPASLGWRIVDATGAIRASALASGGDVSIETVPDGSAVEVYSVGSTPPVVQSYRLTAIWVPAVQVSDLGSLVSPVTVSNGVPGVGAGNLETKASVDEYTFTVPAGGSRVVIDTISGMSGYGDTYGLWSVLDSAGASVKTGTMSYYGQRRFDQVLPAGQYRYRVTSQAEVIGQYSVRLSNA